MKLRGQKSPDARRSRALVDDAWRALLDGVSRRRGFSTSHDVAELAKHVATVSHAYNHDGHDASLDVKRSAALAARMQFFFPRDIAKGWGATRELAHAGLLQKTPLRVLDLGAGIGAMTWGVAHALAENPSSSRFIEAVLLDSDAEALSIAAAIAEDRTSVGDVKVTIRTERQIAPFSASIAGGPFDLIIAGQLLSELDRELDPAERQKKHVRLIRSWLDAIVASGALVIVEPALHDRSRHLHALRDAIAEANAATIFAPCLHSAKCPALAREGDWCSEDRPIDLPAWLVPVARAAGLRWEGSTYSYLVLRKDEASLGAFTKKHAARFRAVSDPIITKGKSEFFLCGVMPKDGKEAPGRVRVTRLDRHETSKNQAWNALARGGLVAIDPPPKLREGRDAEARIDAESTVEPILVARKGEGA